jgi:hypothetical protein
MPIISTRCPVLHASVGYLTDLEGTVTQVFCPEYDPASRSCRLKRSVAAGGPLSQLLERLSEGTLDRRDYRCDVC